MLCALHAPFFTTRLDYVQRWEFVSEFWSFLFDARILRLSFLTEVYFLSARMLFMSIVDCPICSRFPFAFKWMFLEVSNCNSFPEVVLVRWFADSPLQPLLFLCRILLLYPHSCRGGLVDRFFFWGWMEWTILSHFTFIFLEVFAMRAMPALPVSTTISCFVTRKTIFFSRWTSFCLSGTLSFCGIVSLDLASWSSSFALPFLCRVMIKRTFSAFQARGFLTSKIDNLRLSLQLLSKSVLLLLDLLTALFKEILNICCCCSWMSITTVIFLW